MRPYLPLLLLSLFITNLSLLAAVGSSCQSCKARTVKVANR